MGAVWAAAVSMVGLGLFMGFSPTTYALVVRLLTSSRRPGRAVAWICVGLIAAATIMLVVFRFFDPEHLTALLRSRASALLVRRGTDLVAGLLTLVAGLAQLVNWRLHGLRGRRPRARRGERAPSMIGLGLADGVGLSEPATMYVTGRIIASTADGIAVGALLYLVFLVALIGPYLGAAVVWVRMPRLAGAVRGLFGRVSRLDHRPVVGALLIGVGIVFILLAVLHR